MKIELQSITIKNFRSFVGPAQQLDFSELPRGVCFLRGENEVEPSLGANGSGKTTIWNALSWCLFGKTPDGLRNPDIIPWEEKKKSPKVDVSLLIDSVPYVVTRRASPNSLRIDGQDANQEKVERLIGLNFETFTHTVLFGQDRDLFFDLSASDKLGLFTDALDLNRWDERSKVASDEVRILEFRAVALQGELSAARGQVERTKELLERALFDSSEFEEHRLEDLEKLKTGIKALTIQADSALEKRNSASLVEDGALTEKAALDKQFRKLYDKLFELRDEQSQVLAAIEQRKLRIKELKYELADLKSVDTCPTCGQSLEGTSLQKHVKKLKARIELFTIEIDGFNLESISKRYTVQEKKVERVRPAIEEKEAIAKQARSEVDMWTLRLGEIQVNLQTAKREASRLESDTNPHHDQVSKLKKDLKKQKQAVADIVENISRLTKRLERTKFWVRGFKDVRLFIMEEVLAQLQLATNSMLESVGLHDWSIEYDVEQETKSGTTKRGLVVKVLSPQNTESVRWECWSGGERQRLRLVGAMALSEVLLAYAGVEVDTEIFDEPTRSLSEDGVRDLCEFLRTRAKELKKRIWYTDHHTTESSLFSAVVTVCKMPDCGSRIFTA